MSTINVIVVEGCVFEIPIPQSKHEQSQAPVPVGTLLPGQFFLFPFRSEYSEIEFMGISECGQFAIVKENGKDHYRMSKEIYVWKL